MIKWGGIIITACGVMHTAGSLLQAAPQHAGTWMSGEMWGSAYPNFDGAAVAWWYTMYSFGPMLLLLGLVVLSLDRRDIVPPGIIAWTLSAWVVIGLIVGGLSPLPLLIIASVLLLVGGRRRKNRASATQD